MVWGVLSDQHTADMVRGQFLIGLGYARRVEFAAPLAKNEWKVCAIFGKVKEQPVLLVLIQILEDLGASQDVVYSTVGQGQGSSIFGAKIFSDAHNNVGWPGVQALDTLLCGCLFVRELSVTPASLQPGIVKESFQFVHVALSCVKQGLRNSRRRK